jgi:hypothetical protein
MTKSVIIYTYFQSSVSDYNLKFFVEKELQYRENIDYIIVINGFNYDDKNIYFPNISNLTIIPRENIGYDFGGYNCGLEYIQLNNKKYDYYFFMNGGVFGPILPHYFIDSHWSTVFIKKINDIVKLVGTTIVCLPPWDMGGFGPKVEGFFFMVDQIGLDLLQNQQTIFCDHSNKCDAIVKGEYGLSNCILKHGYSIDCMLRKYQNIDWRDPNNYHMNDYIHPSKKNSFYGNSIIPYEVIFYKWFWRKTDTEAEHTLYFELIQQYANNNT